MSMDTLVQHLTDTLRRGHSLFGQPTDIAGTAALASSTTLARGENHVRTGAHHISGLSGVLPTACTQFTDRAAPLLHATAHTDTQLGAALREAATADHHGRRASAAVLHAATTDIATLQPAAHTTAGKKALITALQTHLVSRVIN